MAGWLIVKTHPNLASANSAEDKVYVLAWFLNQVTPCVLDQDRTYHKDGSSVVCHDVISVR